MVKIGDHTFREHIRLLYPFFAFILIIWMLRMVLHAVGAPGWLVRILSVSGASSLSVVLTVLLIHVRNFGSYANVFLASLLLVAWRELLIVLAILFSVVSGIENIYTAPEFSIPENDPYHIWHILGHLTFSIGGGTLLGGAMGCLLLLLLRKLVPAPPVR